jgi:hypothetical protein
MLIRFPRPVQVIQQPPRVRAVEHFPNQQNTTIPFTGHCGATALPSHPDGGSPGCKTPPPGTDPHHAARRIQLRHRLFRFVPARCTSPAAVITSTRVSRSGDHTSPGTQCRCQGRLRGERALRQPRPLRGRADLLEFLSVSENWTTRGRDTACRDRRRNVPSAMLVTPIDWCCFPDWTAPGPRQCHRHFAHQGPGGVVLAPLFTSGRARPEVNNG